MRVVLSRYGDSVDFCWNAAKYQNPSEEARIQAFEQQFSLNSFYGNRGGHREGLRLQKAMLGGLGL
jgi:hypothetical protein